MSVLSNRNAAKLGMSTRTVARKSSIGGALRLCRGLDILKIGKSLLIHSVSYSDLGALKLCLGGLSPQPPRGDGTDEHPHRLSTS